MKATINAKGTEITILSKGDENDFISLTDIARYKNPDEPKDVVKKLDAQPQHHRIPWSLGAVEQPGF